MGAARFGLDAVAEQYERYNAREHLNLGILMRFHVVGLPHTQTDGTYTACAFTGQIINFCKMMTTRGHEVFLYAGERNVAPCSEHIVCHRGDPGIEGYTSISWDAAAPMWRQFNGAVIEALSPRLQPRDFICIIGGVTQRSIADAFPHHMTVEIGVGYEGCFARYRAFTSYAWMHAIYGQQGAAKANGEWFDTVIPCSIDETQFPFRAQPDDYFLFIGRLIDRKGYKIAIDTCRAMDARLIVAGPLSNDCPVAPAGCEYVGVVGPERRGDLMSGARAVFVPTTYLEPFGLVAVEAMACGTPVLTTDWGAFVETNIEGLTGYRCRTLGEFVDGAGAAAALDRNAIRRASVDRYGLDAVAVQYERWFARLGKLWGEGWYAR